jgi:RNA polymerase sigma-70 factor (ECF subfamily)
VPESERVDAHLVTGILVFDEHLNDRGLRHIGHASGVRLGPCSVHYMTEDLPMKDYLQHPDERTPRNRWPVEKGQPANPAKMPPSPLDPRHSPERPDDTSSRLPTREELHKCLREWLPNVEDYLKRRFPEYTVLDALQKAEAAALRAIYGDLHDKMKPEEMTSAGRRAWLITVARHAALTILRRKRLVSLPEGDVLPDRQATHDPEDSNMIREALRRMPPDLRAVIVALYFEGLSGHKAAARLGIPKTTFRRRQAQAISCLRKIIDQLSREF